METTFLKSLFLCTSDQQKKHKLCRGPSNEHSYKDWFQVSQCCREEENNVKFYRRLHGRRRTTPSDNYASLDTLCQGELIILSSFPYIFNNKRKIEWLYLYIAIFSTGDWGFFSYQLL